MLGLAAIISGIFMNQAFRESLLNYSQECRRVADENERRRNQSNRLSYAAGVENDDEDAAHRIQRAEEDLNSVWKKLRDVTEPTPLSASRLQNYEELKDRIFVYQPVLP